MDDFQFLDATAQAELVRKKAVSPLELVEASIKRIERLNPTVNAVIRPMFEEARRDARGNLPDGPFKGVPFLLKDLIAAYMGVPMTHGSKFTKDYVPDHDSELVRRIKAAGLVIAGKTNTPEYGILPTTENALFGRSRNPWNVERTTGGSSGGSAAAVAMGFVPMAHANDGGGSIRIPASCCGLFGLKPTRARNPLGPDSGDIMSGLVAEHVVTRSVRDSAAMLDATGGSDIGDPYYAPPKERSYLEETKRKPRQLRIGLITRSPGGTPIHPDCVAAADDVGRFCEWLGHVVVEAKPPVSGPEMTQAFMVLWFAGMAAQIDGLITTLGRKPEPGELEPGTVAIVEGGRKHSASTYLRALETLQRFSRVIAQYMQEYDVLLTPTLGEPPVALGSFDATPENPIMGLVRSKEFVPFTPLCNVTGQPAMSMPLNWNDEGLPIGTHFVGRFGDEATLFQLAAQIEEARPWADKIPPAAKGGE